MIFGGKKLFSLQTKYLTEENLKKIIKIQKVVRGFICKSKYKRFKKLLLEHPSLIERNNTFISLLKKERSYHEKLRLTIEIFLNPLIEFSKSKMMIISPEEIDIIFSNLIEIKKIHQIVEEEFKDIENLYPFVDGIGIKINKIAPFLTVYGDYVTNFQSATELLIESMEKNSKFEKFVLEKEKEIEMEENHISLRSLLSLPINHLTIYQLHLKLFIKHTPQNHLNYKDLEIAFNTMDATTNFIADNLANSPNRARITKIQKRIIDPKEYKLPQQKLIYQENMIMVCENKNKKKRSSLIILFSQSIVFFEIKKNDALCLLQSFDLEDIEITEERGINLELEKKGFSSFSITLNTESSIDLLQPKSRTLSPSKSSMTLSLSGNLKSSLLSSPLREKKLKYSFFTENIKTKIYWIEGIRKAISTCNKEAYFSKPLQEILKRSDSKEGIPFLIKNTVESLLKNNRISTPQIFRAPGDNETILNLCSKIDKGNLPFYYFLFWSSCLITLKRTGPIEEQQKRVDFNKCKVHDISSILKHFLRHLPEPLFTFSVYPLFIKLHDEKKELKEKMLEEIFLILKNSIPKKNLPLIIYLFSFFTKIIQSSSENLMKSSSVSVVFAPLFIRKPIPSFHFNLF